MSNLFILITLTCEAKLDARHSSRSKGLIVHAEVVNRYTSSKPIILILKESLTIKDTAPACVFPSLKEGR